MDKDYQQYGPEWKKEISKMPKKTLIKFASHSLIKMNEKIKELTRKTPNITVNVTGEEAKTLMKEFKETFKPDKVIADLEKKLKAAKNESEEWHTRLTNQTAENYKLMAKINELKKQLKK